MIKGKFGQYFRENGGNKSMKYILASQLSLQSFVKYIQSFRMDKQSEGTWRKWDTSSNVATLTNYLFIRMSLKLRDVWYCPVGGSGVVITASNDAEEPVFTPVGAPDKSNKIKFSSIKRYHTLKNYA